MRKSLLLLSAVAIAASANAQERKINAPQGSSVDMSAIRTHDRALTKSRQSGFAAKTTAAPRWYSYTDYFDQNESATSSSVALSLPYLWGSNTVLMNFSSGFDTANLVSYGGVIDPSFSGFNNFSYYPGEMQINSTNAYAIDSLQFTGVYLNNPASLTVDTLRVSFVYGDGSTASDIYKVSTTINTGSILTNYGAVGSTIDNYRMHMNTGTLTASGTTVITKNILLDNTSTPPSWAVDTVNGLYVGRVAVGTAGTGISIPAGSMVGMSVTFLSGATMPMLYDTVFFGSPAVPPVKYNMFRAGVVHRGVAGTPAFPSYSATDRNTGNYVDKTTTNYYVPHWFWSSGASAASVQYPDFAVRAICASCGVVVDGTSSVNEVAKTTKVNAYPNPATGELNIPFSITKSADVNVTLTNMLGQVVATKNMGNVANGTAVFNISSVPSGIYTYTVVADGVATTGRVAIAH